MRDLPLELIAQNVLLQRKPRTAIKIYNDQGDFWFTTHDDIVPGDGLDVIKNVITTRIASQNVKPEKGYSTIGGMNLKLQDKDRILTDKLRSITLANDTLNNNNAEVYFGFAGMDFTNYGKLFTFRIDNVGNTQIEYNIKLSDIQREERVKIFTVKETKLLGVIEDDIPVDLTVSTILNGSGIVEFLNASEFIMVEHDSDWDIDPSVTIGYFEIKGVDAFGNNTFETFSYTGFDGGNSNRLTGVTRSRFGTSPIDVKGTISGGSSH